MIGSLVHWVIESFLKVIEASKAVRRRREELWFECYPIMDKEIKLDKWGRDCTWVRV